MDFSKLVSAQYLYPVLGFTFSGLVWLARFFVKKALEKATVTVNAALATLDRIEAQNNIALTNHFPHIQANGEKTNELLTAIQLGQAENTGYLKAMAEHLQK